MSTLTLERPAVDATMASFADLNLRPTTLAALDDMAIDVPTPIQAAALPALLAGRDLIGQARTGSGKTLAFGIPAAELIDVAQRAVQVLVLTPTRELAVQVGGVLDQLAAPRGVVTTLIFGGRAMGPQKEALRRGAHVVVGTPGRVLDLLNQGVMRLDRVRFLVLDEADEMLDRGFAPDVERIIGRTPKDRQTSLFSATVPDWVQQTAAKHLDKPIVAAVDPNPEDAAPIEHVAYDVPGGDKLSALRDLLDRRGEGSIIVFGRTKHGVKKLARQLSIAGYPVAALQGNLSQNARDAVMEDFRAGRVRILLATNVAARGLDIAGVDQVINYELPESSDLLTHRVGRTGRMGRRGQALTLLGPEDWAKWRQLERGLGRNVPRKPWTGALAARAEGQEPVQTTARPALERPVAPARLSPRGERGPARSDQPARTPASSPAPQPNRPSTHESDDWDDVVRLDRDVSFSRDLMTAHSRDPQRPVWAGGGARPSAPPRLAAPAPARRRGGRHQAGPHEIVCAGCGSAATVPFHPDPARPVFCGDCFRMRSGRQPAAAAPAG